MANEAKTTKAASDADRIAQLETQLAETTRKLDTVLNLMARQQGEETEELREAKRWAMLSAEEKTRIVLDRQFPKTPDDKLFRCSMTDEKGRPDNFPLVVPARSDLEAEGRYKHLMGIRNTKGTISVQAAA